MPDLREEEAFFDQQGLEILKNQDSLVVNDPPGFLAGSSIAFDYIMKLIVFQIFI